MSKRSSKQFVPKVVRDIVDLLDFFLDNHSVGLLVLMGEVCFPSSRELFEMICCKERGEYDVDTDIRVQGGQQIPEAQRIVERVEHFEHTMKTVGGIGHIVEAFQEFKRHSPREYGILRDSIKVKRGRPFKSGDYTAQKIAERHHMHQNSMRRNRNYIVLKLAHEIAFPGAHSLWREYVA